jgi:hypothetical protein
VVLARELGPLLGPLVLTELVELLEAEAPPEPLLEVVPEPVLGPVLEPVLPKMSYQRNFIIATGYLTYMNAKVK